MLKNVRRERFLRQFLQTPPDRARRHAGRHRHRGNATISRGKRLCRRDQTTAPFIEKGRHRQKPLSDGLDIDHHHHIWYDKTVVNSIFTLSEVDSIICGRALSRGFSYRCIEDAYHARKFEIRSRTQCLAGAMTACSTLDEFASALARR